MTRKFKGFLICDAPNGFQIPQKFVLHSTSKV